MKNILYAFLLISTGFFVISCTDEGDSGPPTVEVISPEANEVFQIGSTINMKFRFKDDYGVRFYSYQFFHETANIPGEFKNRKDIEINVPSNEFEVSPSVIIPTMTYDSIPTAIGNYTLRVIAVDWYNNQEVVDTPIKIEPSNLNK